MTASPISRNGIARPSASAHTIRTKLFFSFILKSNERYWSQYSTVEIYWKSFPHAYSHPSLSSTRMSSRTRDFHLRRIFSMHDFFLLLSHCSHGILFDSHAANTRRTNSHTWLHSIDPPEQPATSNAYNMCVACCANSSRIITKFN